MRPLLLLLLVASLPIHAQAVRPPPATGSLIVQQPPSYPGVTHGPAGAGASHGSLAAPEKSVLRSPNKRLLPPTKEAGVWAADGVSRPGSAPPTLFGVPLPYPDMAGDDAESFVRACVGRIMMASFVADPARYIDGLPPDVRKCAAAEAYEECALQYREEKFPTVAARMALPVEEQERVAGVVAHAIALRREYCKGVTLAQSARDALGRVLETWRKSRT